MSRQARYRVAAVVLSGLIFGAPLLINGTANAEQLDPSDRRVSFNGDGVLGLTCESKPSVESMTVPADSVIQVQNRTGRDAQLKLSGVPRGMIPENGSADLVFRRGTTSVLLTPECDDTDNVVPMLVTASPSASAGRPRPVPVPPGGGLGSQSRPAKSGLPARTSAGSAKSGPAASAQRPDQNRTAGDEPRKPSGARPPAAASSAAAAVGTLSQSEVRRRLQARALTGTGEVGAPAFAGMPPGERKALVPSSPAATVGDQITDTVTPSDADGADVPMLQVDEPSGAATEPVAAVGPIREGKPIGLLGLTALVCVLGVSIATIRAIVSQRASRANMA
jgi:hypothetical protein